MRLLWKKKADVEGYFKKAKISWDGRFVVVGDSSGWVYFININGTELWRRRVSPSSIDDVAIADDANHIAATDGVFVYMLDRDGRLLWEKRISDKKWDYGQVSFFRDGNLLCIEVLSKIGILDASGEWRLKPLKLEHHVERIKTSRDLIFIADEEKVYVYDMQAKLLQTFEAKVKVNCFDCTPDGKYVVIGSEEMSVYLFRRGLTKQPPSVKTITLHNATIITPPIKRVEWNLVWERRLQDPTGCLAMSSNAEYIVCSSEAKAKIIALAKNGSMLWEADLQRVIPLGDVMPISVSNDGTVWTATPYGWYIVGIKEGKVFLRADVRDIVGYFTSYGIQDIKISKDGKYMVMTIPGEPVRFYRINDSKLFELWKWNPIVDADFVELSDDNNYVIIGNANGQITLLKRDGTLVWEKELPRRYVSRHLTFIPNSNLMCCLGYLEGEGYAVGVLDLDGNWVVKPFPLEKASSPGRFGHGISVSSDFIFIPMELAGSNKIYVYSWKDEEVVSEITVKGGVRDLAATADGKYLAVCDDLFRVYLFGGKGD
jgi:outer membrane protein assembly factor BamB